MPHLCFVSPWFLVKSVVADRQLACYVRMASYRAMQDFGSMRDCWRNAHCIGAAARPFVGTVVRLAKRIPALPITWCWLSADSRCVTVQYRCGRRLKRSGAGHPVRLPTCYPKQWSIGDRVAFAGLSKSCDAHATQLSSPLIRFYFVRLSTAYSAKV